MNEIPQPTSENIIPPGQKTIRLDASFAQLERSRNLVYPDGFHIYFTIPEVGEVDLFFEDRIFEDVIDDYIKFLHFPLEKPKLCFVSIKISPKNRQNPPPRCKVEINKKIYQGTPELMDPDDEDSAFLYTLKDIASEEEAYALFFPDDPAAVFSQTPLTISFD